MIYFYLNAPKSVSSMFILSSKVQKITSPNNANIVMHAAKCIKYITYMYTFTFVYKQ